MGKRWDKGDLKEFSENTYIDMHSWCFTPKSFQTLIYQLNALGYIDLMVSDMYVEKNCIEFGIELKKGSVEFNKTELKKLYIACKKEEREVFDDAEVLIEKKRQNKKIYIYGTGKVAQRTIKLFEKCQVDYIGHIVSNGRKVVEKYNDHPVFELNDIENSNQLCIALGVSTQFRSEIIFELEKRKMEYIF